MRISLQKYRQVVTAFRCYAEDGEDLSKVPAGYDPGFFSGKCNNFVEIPPTAYALDKLREDGFALNILPPVEAFVADEKPYYVDSLLPFGTHPDLMPHQIETLFHAAKNKDLNSSVRMLLADDPRLGKSIQALAIVNWLKPLEDVLILCPKPLIPQWRQYIIDWLGEAPIILNGEDGSRLHLLINMQGKVRPGIYLTNWETLYMPQTGKLIASSKWGIIIGDEAHRLKNRKSKLSKSMQIVAQKTQHLLLLSATFVENQPIDWWQPLNLLAPKRFNSFWRFAGQYCQLRQGQWGIEILQPQNQDILADEITPFVVQRKAEDVGNMPEKIYENYPAELEAWHQDFYNQVKKQILLELEDKDLLIANVISRLTFLREAAIHPYLLDKSFYTKGFNTGKLAVLTELVNNRLPDNEQIIIYSSFIGGCKIVQHLFDGANTALCAGDVNEVDKFTAGDARILIATPQKGGIGLNLFNANYVIYLDLMWSSIQLRQSQERVRAMGKQGPVYIITLSARGTVDEYVQEVLSAKQRNLTEFEMGKQVIGYLKGIK